MTETALILFGICILLFIGTVAYEIYDDGKRIK